MGNLLIKEMDEQEKPYEKCLAYGAEALTDAELLAVIIRTGTKGESSIDLAKHILKQHERYAGILGIIHMTISELKAIKGIGDVKAVQLKCIAELSKRMAKASISDGLSFTHPQIIAEYFMEDMRHKEKEELVLLLLNSKNKFLRHVTLSVGTVNSSLISPREIFIESLRYQAVSIILMHNHPSGNPSPSMEDISVTQQVKEAGHLVGIPLLDHIIIGDNRYISMKERGIL